MDVRAFLLPGIGHHPQGPTKAMHTLKAMKNPLVVLALVPIFGLAGCGVIAEVLYDDAVFGARERCERLISMPERQSCLQRLNTAKRQADELRKK